MKKWIAFVLMLAVLMSLTACMGNKKKQVSTSDMSVTGVNKISGTVEYTLKYIYTSADVRPPMYDSVYMHYEADAGNVYVVIVMDVKNTGGNSVTADDMLSVSVKLGDKNYNTNCVVEEDGGTGFGYANITGVDALETVRLNYLFQIPQGTSTANMEITATAGNQAHSATVSLEQFASRVKTVAKGEVITDNTTLSATLLDVYFSQTLYPPVIDGAYCSYTAQIGKTYLIVKMNVKNLMGTDLKYSKIAGVSCEYDGKYIYYANAVFEEDGGSDLNGFASQYAIDPLNTGVVYYLAEVPTEVENGSVVITMYIAGEYYKYEIK